MSRSGGIARSRPPDDLALLQLAFVAAWRAAIWFDLARRQRPVGKHAATAIGLAPQWCEGSCCQRGRVDAVWRSHSNCCGSSGALANRGQRARGVARLSMSRIIDVCTLAAHHSTTSNDRLAASRRMLERPLCPRGCGVRYGVLHRTRPRGAQRCALCRTGSSPVGAHTRLLAVSGSGYTSRLAR